MECGMWNAKNLLPLPKNVHYPLSIILFFVSLHQKEQHNG